MTTEYAITLGVDVGKTAHHECALTPDGQKVYDHELPQDEAALRKVVTVLQDHGPVLVVVDQPNTQTETHTSDSAALRHHEVIPQPQKRGTNPIGQ